MNRHHVHQLSHPRPAMACLVAVCGPAAVLLLRLRSQVNGENGERAVIQELQLSPMGVVEMIYPNNSDTQSRLGINIFQQVRAPAVSSLERDCIQQLLQR